MNNQLFWKKKELLSSLFAVFVVAIHNTYSDCYIPEYTFAQKFSTLFSNVIPAVAVPGFLVLSGIAFYRDYSYEKTLAKLRSRFFTLFVPYILWNTIWMFFTIVLTYSPLANIAQDKVLFTMSASNILQGIFYFKYNVVFWYIFVLICFSLCAPLIYFMLKKKIAGGGILLLLLVTMDLYDDWVSAIGFRSYCIYFYFLGSYLGIHYFEHLNCKLKKELSIQVLYGIVVCLSIGALYFMRVFACNSKTLESFFLTLYLSSIWGAFDLAVKRGRVFSWVKESFIIYAVHMNLQSIVVKICEKFLPRRIWLLPVGFVLQIAITVYLIIVADKILMHICPVFWNILKGNYRKEEKNVNGEGRSKAEKC